MSDAPSHRQFFGDRDHVFRLTPPLILELERVTGTGIGGLSRRFFGGDFKHQELLEVVRLGLVGGGESPQTAASLVATYAATMPVMDLYAVTLPVIETVMFGKAAPKKGSRK